MGRVGSSRLVVTKQGGGGEGAEEREGWMKPHDVKVKEKGLY